MSGGDERSVRATVHAGDALHLTVRSAVVSVEALSAPVSSAFDRPEPQHPAPSSSLAMLALPLPCGDALLLIWSCRPWTNPLHPLYAPLMTEVVVKGDFAIVLTDCGI